MLIKKLVAIFQHPYCVAIISGFWLCVPRWRKEAGNYTRHCGRSNDHRLAEQYIGWLSSVGKARRFEREQIK